MRKITFVLITMLAVTAIAATMALADPCPTMKTAAAKAGDAKAPCAGEAMEACCVDAAK